MGSILDIKSSGLGSAVKSVKRGSKKVDEKVEKAHRKVRRGVTKVAKRKPKTIYVGRKKKKKRI